MYDRAERDKRERRERAAAQKKLLVVSATAQPEGLSKAHGVTYGSGGGGGPKGALSREAGPFGVEGGGGDDGDAKQPSALRRCFAFLFSLSPPPSFRQPESISQ